jgi:hypothetical protein
MGRIILKSFFPLFAMMALTVLGGCSGPQTASAPETGQATAPTAIEGASRQSHAWVAYRQYRTAVSLEEKRKWICIAANQNLPEAQSELARLHWPRPGAPRSPFNRDIIQAYAWTLIAIDNGQDLKDIEERLGYALTPDEQWEATRKAAFWPPDPSHCDRISATGYHGNS